MNTTHYALVTGANRGLGLEVCRQLLAKGKPVVLTSRKSNAGQEAIRKLKPLGTVEYLQLDTNDEKSIESAVGEISRRFSGKIDVLVNNAGVLEQPWTAEVYDRTIRTNVHGPISLFQKLVPHMSDGGVIVMVSSGLGCLAYLSEDYKTKVTSASSLEDLGRVTFVADSPIAHQGLLSPSYSISKALLNRAVVLMSQDQDIQKRNISLVAVCPGWCRTDMGGTGADRSAEQGAASIIWAVDHGAQPEVRGGFYRDGRRLEY